MSATADKARFFLEQSVPELKEYERKKIFTPEEITAITKKRSDFEHKINARGSSPSDYAQYAEFEINVDALRRKRVKRLGIKSTAHNGQRRVFFVFDRGTRKFPGDVGLWMQSIEYAKKQKAYKKVTEMLTNVLRLHPAKADLWIYAAQFALEENGDMTEARSYMQRGLRFCKSSRHLWTEYLRLEMAYIAKFHARRQILGILDKQKTAEVSRDDNEDDSDMEVLQLPKLTEEDINPQSAETDEVNEAALSNLDATPIMSGAIPIVIFDSAMAQFDHDPAVAHALFGVVSDFDQVPVSRNILQHIQDALMVHSRDSIHASATSIQMPLIGLETDNVAFPAGVRAALQRMAEGLATAQKKQDLIEWCKNWLDSLLSGDLDPAIKAVLSSKRQQLA